MSEHSLTSSKLTIGRDDVIWAVCWALGSALVWLGALLQWLPPLTPSFLTLCVLIASVVTAWLRRKLFAEPSQDRSETEHSRPRDPETSSTHGLWLASLFASTYWLAFALASAGSFFDALPAILLLVFSEAAQHASLDYRHLPWLTGVVTEASLAVRRRWLSWVDANPDPQLLPKSTRRSEAGALGDISAPSSGTLLSDTDPDPGETDLHDFDRKTTDGVDESGKRFLAGEIRGSLLGDWQIQNLVVGFCPAFERVPEVELELETDGLSATLEHCTQAGMRVQLRRRPHAVATLGEHSPSAAAGDADGPFAERYQLGWFAQAAGRTATGDTAAEDKATEGDFEPLTAASRLP